MEFLAISLASLDRLFYLSLGRGRLALLFCSALRTSLARRLRSLHSRCPRLGSKGKPFQMTTSYVLAQSEREKMNQFLTTKRRVVTEIDLVGLGGALCVWRVALSGFHCLETNSCQIVSALSQRLQKHSEQFAVIGGSIIICRFFRVVALDGSKYIIAALTSPAFSPSTTLLYFSPDIVLFFYTFALYC